MKNYSNEVLSVANQMFLKSFNEISFELFKKANENWYELINEPSSALILEEWLGEQDEQVLRDEFEEVYKNDDIVNDYTDNENGFLKWVAEQYRNEIDEWWFEQENVPMWGTIFEAKDNFISEKILKDVDKLYDLGIGVIDETDETLACLFIAGAGYDFWSAHWIPLFEHWNWLNVKQIDEEEEKSNK